MIAIIDYDAGNILSVKKAFEYLGTEVTVTSDPKILLEAEKVVLPGVGAFGDAMGNLESRGLVDVIKKIVAKKTPFFGICLGLQLLFEESEESPGVKGLGLLPGRIMRFPENMGLTIPQIGWNDLKFPKGSALFKGIEENSYIYLVHSYYLEAKDPGDVIAMCNYGIDYAVAVEHENIFACQFHPEKSSKVGLAILKNFVEL